MKKILAVLLCMVLILGLFGCGKTDTQPSDNGKDAPADDKGQLITIGEPDIRQWPSETNTGNSFVLFIAPVKNISGGTVFYRSVVFEFIDKDGNVMKEASSASAAPMRLDPGEEGIVFDTYVCKDGFDYLDPDLTVKVTVEAVQDTYGLRSVRISGEDCQVTFREDNFRNVYAEGTYTNTTGKDIEDPDGMLIMYDSDGNILFPMYWFLMDPLPADGEAVISTNSYPLPDGKGWEDVASWDLWINISGE